MKSKHLIIVSLLLAIVAMGAVSASENIASDDVLATDDVTDNPIEESPVDEAIGQSDDLGQSIELEPSDFNASIKDSIDLDDENDRVVVDYTVPQDVSGKIDVYVDYMETPAYSKEAVFGQTINITADNLNIINPGEYHIKVNYVSNSGDSLTIAQHTLKAHVYTEKDFSIGYDKLITSKNDNLVSHFSYPVTGALTLSVNGTPRCTKDIKELYETIHIYLSNLNITEDGIYNISAKYVIGTTSKEIDLGNSTVEVYGVEWDENEYVSLYSSVDILDHKDYLIEIDNNGKYIDGTVLVYVDGTLKLTKEIHAGDERILFDVTVDDLGIYNNIALGNHTVKVIYMKDNAEKHEVEKSVDFYAKPVFVNNFIVSVGERDVLEITYIKGFNGTATLYNAVKEQYEDYPGYYDWVNVSVYKSANFVDGVATIPFDSMDEGEHLFILNITGYDLEERISVTSKRNSPGFSASASASEITVGNSVVVKLSGPKSGNAVIICLDDKEYNSISFASGSISEAIADLSVGTHRIKVYFDDGINFYSNTFQVTVKNAPAPATAKNADKITLALKKVKVKKSAKKLVLQATLKRGNKALIGKKVTFKFNGKTYTAKTNKNGIAKVTIKSKVLKKLKVGKKVKYQASYSNVVVKKTAKVKK